MGSPKVVRWGIMATGGIARTFTKDILISPSTRKVTDVKHVVAAVASSSSLSAAEQFISDLVAPAQSAECTPYASYDALVRDPNVDIVYVASPHSHHFQNAMLCLSHNKPVLCEKALTVNAAQAKILYQTAKEKGLFFMEAVWTRYFPLSIAVRKHITDHNIGDIVRATADLSLGVDPAEEFDLGSRMVNLDLAGGCLLDLGIYSLTWIFQTLYHTLTPELRDQGRPRVVGAAMTPEPRTGADESTVILLEFPKSSPTGKTTTHAMATTAMRVSDDPARKGSHAGAEVPAVRLQGEKGEIQVFGPIFRPTRYRLVPAAKDSKVIDQTFTFEGGAHGMMYEADAAARCLLKGQLESSIMPWAESILIMEIMDEVRQRGCLSYPEAIESTTYPRTLSSKKT